MNHAAKVLVVAGLAALAWAAAPVAEEQPPIRIGASSSQTGVAALVSQPQLRGYRLCVRHVNEKGGVLGRKLDLVLYDNGSDPATAVRLYEKLITRDKMDLVLGPYGSPITDLVANVTEKHKMPMVAPTATTTSIYRKDRKFIFSVFPPAEVFLEGLIDLAAKKGLKTVARRVPGRSRWVPDRAQGADVPVAGRQEGARLARGAGAGEGALPDPAVESAPVSKADSGLASRTSARLRTRPSLGHPRSPPAIDPRPASVTGIWCRFAEMPARRQPG